MAPLEIEPTEAPSPSAATSAYARLHLDDDIPDLYDDTIYAAHSYDAAVWELYRPALIDIVARWSAHRCRVNYLDFACGTGRILATLEPFATSALGVDISQQMAARAAAKVRLATVRCVDILEDPEVLATDFDLITAFRFFLNTEPAMREPVMRALADRLAGPESLLIFNVHANAWGADGLQSVYRRARGWPPTGTLSYPEIARVVAASGLEIKEWHGFGMWPHRFYRKRLAPAARTADAIAARIRALRWISKDLLFVCGRAA